MDSNEDPKNLTNSNVLAVGSKRQRVQVQRLRFSELALKNNQNLTPVKVNPGENGSNQSSPSPGNASPKWESAANRLIAKQRISPGARNSKANGTPNSNKSASLPGTPTGHGRIQTPEFDDASSRTSQDDQDRTPRARMSARMKRESPRTPMDGGSQKSMDGKNLDKSNAEAARSAKPGIQIQQIPELFVKLQSGASVENVNGAKGLWTLVTGGKKEEVLSVPDCLDVMAENLKTGPTQSRFFVLAILGESAYFDPKWSVKISSHSSIRTGVVEAMRHGKGIEGEACKVVRNCSANSADSAKLWAEQEGFLQVMKGCFSASSHIKSCVVGAICSLSRSAGAACVMERFNLIPEVLEPCIKERIAGDIGTDIRDRNRITVACAAMAILNIRQAKSSSLSSSKDKASNLPHRTSTESLRPANARSHEGAGGEQNEGYVLEKRVIINMVRILSSAIDEMPFAGVKFSPEAALFSFPAAVQHRANVAVFCDQGLVELLLSLIQRHRPASTGGEGDSAQKSDPTQADTADKVEGGKDETNIRLIELALQTMLTMSKTEGGAGHECLQRMNLLNSQELLQGLAGWSVNRTEEAPKVERVARLATEVRDLLSQAGS